jgi:hypothetical protein
MKHQSNLRREITLVLLIKVILIIFIWAFFVREYSMKLDEQQIANHLIAKPESNQSSKQVMEPSNDF